MSHSGGSHMASEADGLVGTCTKRRALRPGGSGIYQVTSLSLSPPSSLHYRIYDLLSVFLSEIDFQEDH